MGCSRVLPWLMLASVLATAGSRSYTLLEAIKNRKTLGQDKVLEAVRTASNIDEQDDKGFTALMWAATIADVEIVKAILLAGASVNLQSKLGSTALIFAAQYSQPEIVDAILKHHPDVNLQDKIGNTALMLAQYNQPEIVAAILRHHPDVNLQNKYGWTALMYAARYRKPEIVDAILKHKPLLDLQDKSGATALFLAVGNEHGPAAAAAKVKALLRAGAAVDLANYAGRTPLMKAADWGLRNASEALLRHGSLPELRSRSGHNALDFARLRETRVHSSSSKIQTKALIQRLERVTPTGVGLAGKYFTSGTTWLFLGSGLAVGLCAGFCLVAMGKRGSLQPSSQQVTVSISSRRLAIKSLTKQIWKAEAFRALELVACILLPLSMTMLWIEPLSFLPCYLIVYILPALACWQQKARRFPAVLLVSPATRPGLRCPVRFPRAVATVAQLALVCWMPGHCVEPIHYYIYGQMDLANTTTTFPVNAMVHGHLPLLSRASAEMACPAKTSFPARERSLFFGAQCVVASVSFVWVVFVAMDTCCGFMQSATSDQQAVEQLSERIAATETKEEIAEITDPVAVSPESSIQCLPPGGIRFTVGMAVVDIFLDLYSVYSCIMAAQLKFASLMVAIITTSCTVEALSSDPRILPKQVEASLRRGLSTDALRHALASEACFEAPLSLCLTAYVFVFNVRGGGLLTLVLSFMSIAVSTYHTASFLCWIIDLGLEKDDAEMGEDTAKKDCDVELCDHHKKGYASVLLREH
ncbi:unnamed protein product [Symbiodinium sp. CCMP2456]|nr:unnamed protein product [Symbiodinium sp. CCMP2456]